MVKYQKSCIEIEKKKEELSKRLLLFNELVINILYQNYKV